MKIILSIILLVSSLFAINGRVIKVSDGDTIKILTSDNQQIKIRLYGIDAPEKKQAFGRKATELLSDLIAGKQVDIQTYNKDRYGRVIGIIYLNGKDINAEMVANGLAWAYTYYTNKYLPEQENAKSHHLGLWSDPNPINPYDFRKSHKKKHREYK